MTADTCCLEVVVIASYMPLVAETGLKDYREPVVVAS